MKGTVTKVVLLFAFVALLAGPSSAQYSLDPFWMVDQSFQGTPNPNVLKNALPGSTVPGFWWRDTANQNALWAHTLSEFAGDVTQVYSSPEIQAWVYCSQRGPNVVMLTTETQYVLIGTGGGTNEANLAKMKFTAAVPGLSSKVLKAVVYPDAYPESWQGVRRWTAGTGVFFYVSHSFVEATQRQMMVSHGLRQRQSMVNGETLRTGSDGYLGAGSTYFYRPILAEPGPLLTALTATVITHLSFYLDTVLITVYATNDVDAGLLVYAPDQKIVIAPNMGTYLPDAGSIARPGMGLQNWIGVIGAIRGLAPTTYLPLNGKPIIGGEEIQSALGAQYSALRYVLDETARRINLFEPLDDIVPAVQLPAALADSPYTQEFVGKVEYLVRDAYHGYMGNFDGDATKLTTLSTEERAMRLVRQIAGGPSRATTIARECLEEGTQGGAQTAFELATALRITNPSTEVDKIYVTAVRKLAYSQKSAYTRNYYLTLIEGL